MSHENDLNPADRELEDALRSLTPVTARIDPIAAAFSAGAKSARRTTRVWQTVAAIMLVALVGAQMNFQKPAATYTNVIQASLPQAAQSVSDQSVLVLQRSVRDRGIDALPRAAVPAIQRFNAKDLF